MIEAKKFDYYNDIYKDSQQYKLHYIKSIYFNIWTNILNNIIKKYPIKSKILDIGCGSGQFGHLLFDNEYKNYLGIDFSQEAINIAKTFSPQKYQKNNYQEINFNEFDIIISLEVLEHLDNDLELIEKIPKDKIFIFSVPNFKCKSHVRTYNEDIIKERYSEYLKLEKINNYNTSKTNIVYYCESIKL